MNIFEDQTTGQTDTNQAQTETQTQEDWLAKVVEAKGDKFKDTQVLAKSKLEADNHIASLERQLAELREELGKESYSQKLLEQLQTKAPTPTPVNTEVAQEQNGGTKTSDTKPELSEDFLKSLVEKTLTERELRGTTEQNIAAVSKELEAKYGTNAKSHVEQKAKALGLSMERLQALAAESPTAFMALIGEPQKSFQPPVSGSVRTEGVNFQGSTERDFKYYQNLRRTNKKLYYDPKTQRQMIADKTRLGSNFGN